MTCTSILRSKRIKPAVIAMIILAGIICLTGCGKKVIKSLSGRYYCPDRDIEEYVLTFSKDGEVDAGLLGKGTYSIGDDGSFCIDINLFHGNGRVNDDASVDFSTDDGTFYHYIPEGLRPSGDGHMETEKPSGRTIMIGRMPFEYDPEKISVSERQTDEKGRIFYQMTNDGKTVTGTVGTDERMLSDTLFPSTKDEAVMAVMDRGINGSCRCIEGKDHYLVLMLTGYTDTNCAVYYMYLIPRKSPQGDEETFFGAFYFYDKERRTSPEEYDSIKKALESAAGAGICPYTYQDVMHSLYQQKLQM